MQQRGFSAPAPPDQRDKLSLRDRKSTRLNSSHSQISYAVFCLKKKKKHHVPENDTGNIRHPYTPSSSFFSPDARAQPAPVPACRARARATWLAPVLYTTTT